MRVYVAPAPVESKALERVCQALVTFGPNRLEYVSERDEADLVVLHVIGRQDRTLATARRLRDRGQKYAVIQYCLRSTQRPDTAGWLPLWQKAVLVWSYYDLYGLCAEDGTPADFPFYHEPLGVNHKIFRPRNKGERSFVIGTSGLAWTSESVREAATAAQRLGRAVFHLGPEMKRPHVLCRSGIDDSELAKWLNRCEFVASLRRTEGFELLAAEGLMCGARPICFDRPHYRRWYEPWAEFIPEGSRDEVINSLEAVFRRGARPVTNEEFLQAADRFSWYFIIRGFWDKVWIYQS